MQVVLMVVGVVVALVVAVWAGSRMLKDPGSVSSGGNAFGGFDVFNPGRERAEHDLESQKHQTTVTPADGDENRPMRVDTEANTVRIRRPAPKDPPA